MMQILFFQISRTLQRELAECIRTIHGNVHFADTPTEAIKILETVPITVLVLELHAISDVGVLQYVNRYYQQVRVILTAEADLKEAITVLKHGHFDLLPKPFALRHLRDMLAGEGEQQEQGALA